jgi:transposase-like protein
MPRKQPAYPPELRERAVRMVAEATSDYESESSAIRMVANLLSIDDPELLRKWVRQAKTGNGSRQVNSKWRLLKPIFSPASETQQPSWSSHSARG